MGKNKKYADFFESAKESVPKELYDDAIKRADIEFAKMAKSSIVDSEKIPNSVKLKKEAQKRLRELVNSQYGGSYRKCLDEVLQEELKKGIKIHQAEKENLPLNQVLVQVDEKQYYLPKSRLKPLLEIVEGYENSESSVSWREAFKGVLGKYSKQGAILKGARLRLDMTQKQLSEKTGIKVANISKMENGKRPIGLSVAKKLAKALKCSPSMLVFPQEG